MEKLTAPMLRDQAAALPPVPITESRDEVDNVIHSADTRVLSDIALPTFNMAVWKRRLPPWLELSHWAQNTKTSFEKILPTDQVSRIAWEHSLKPALQGLDARALDWLLTDIITLVQRFSAVSLEPRVKLFFGPVRTDQCRKFHVDYLRYRMVSTYLGPGTQWVTSSTIEQLTAQHADCPCDINDALLRGPHYILHAGTGDVLMMKAELTSARRSIVHRSPPIIDSGHVRVVLVISSTQK